MMRRIVRTAGILILLACGVLSAADIDGVSILNAVDKQRYFESDDFSAEIAMVREDPEDGIEKFVVRQFRRDSEEKFVFLFQEPPVRKGQGYLSIGDNLWFYDPESRKFSHTSMKEQFGGTDARNSDFGFSEMNEDYRVLSIEEGTLGKYDVYILDLEARHNEVTYPKQKIWVTRELYLVLKTEDYSATARLLRTSLFPSYARAGEQYVASKMIFIDRLVEGQKTTIALSNISLAPLPNTLFTKSYIERVNR